MRVSLFVTCLNDTLFLQRGVAVLRLLDPEEVRLKQEMVASCEQLIGIFDRTKWQSSALLSFVPADSVSAILTVMGAPVQEWRDHGTDIVAARPEQVLRSPERLPWLRAERAS